MHDPHCGLKDGGTLGAKLGLLWRTSYADCPWSTSDAIQKKGLKLVMADGAEHFIKDVIASDMSKAGSQDVVILALKGL